MGVLTALTQRWRLQMRIYRERVPDIARGIVKALVAAELRSC